MDVAVLGAESNGLAFAGLCARAGWTVALYAEDANEVMDAIDHVEGRVGEDAARSIEGTTDLDGAVGNAGLVLDATDRDEAGHRDLVAAVEDAVDDDALVAAGSPSLSSTAVAAGLREPERALGLNVVRADDDPVIEVVLADQTGPETLERGRSVVEELDATPIVVRDAPGLASQRLELALVVEAIRLVESGVAGVEGVDATLELGRDHPDGPLALADRLGLDVVLEALEDLAERLDGRFDPPGLLREKVAAGTLGARTGEGFYEWEDGERTGPADPGTTGAPEPERTERR